MNSNEYIGLANKLLISKIELFEKYKIVTDSMLNCDIDELTEHVEKRQELQSEINELDEQLNDLYIKSGQAQLKQAVFNKFAWGECPEQLKEVFLNGQKLASIIYRINEKEQLVYSHVETQKEMLLSKIKQQNKGNNANAVKYYNFSNNSKNNFTIFDNKY